MAGNCIRGTLHKNRKNKRDPLLTILIVLFVIIYIVSIGTIGYRIFAGQEWIDAFVNGALVFTATTLVEPVNTYEGKVFTGIYNLLSGVFVLVLLGVILSQALHMFDGDEEDTVIVECLCPICSDCWDDHEVSNVFDTDTL